MTANERCGVLSALIPLLTCLACNNATADGAASTTGGLGSDGTQSTSGGSSNGQGGATKSLVQGGSGGTRFDSTSSTSQGGWINSASARGSTGGASSSSTSVGGAVLNTGENNTTTHNDMNRGGSSSNSSSGGRVQGDATSSASGGRAGNSTSSWKGGASTTLSSSSNGGTTTSSMTGRGGVDGGASGMPGSMPQAGQSHSHDHCVDGEDADPRDAQLPSKPDRWTSSAGAIDLVEPQAVLDWMTERIWQPSHDAWHNIRRCQGGALTIGAGSSAICSHTELVPDHQECEDAEDGYQFLVMHRHMLTSLKQAFPKHADLFSGFPHFPTSASDVPTEWQGRWGSGWTQDVQETAKLLESIENNLSQFATEGD
ncbi:MAG TPA: hypothetical protein VIV60_36795, partial [Polyangiaceae bacterium]